jgi:hypothetical protein
LSHSCISKFKLKADLTYLQECQPVTKKLNGWRKFEELTFLLGYEVGDRAYTGAFRRSRQSSEPPEAFRYSKQKPVRRITPCQHRTVVQDLLAEVEQTIAETRVDGHRLWRAWWLQIERPRRQIFGVVMIEEHRHSIAALLSVPVRLQV